MPKKVTRIEATKKAIPKTKKPRLRVAAYACVSTVKEAQENSLQAQKDYFRKYIRANPEWWFAGLYFDDGVSGLSFRKREGFNRMVQDALDGKIDRIVTKSLSRFARNTVDSLITIRKLKAVGVAVYFQKENIDTMDSTGEFLITLLSSFAEEESRSISENVTWSQRHRFSQGEYTAPFSRFLGYRRGANGEYVIDEEQAEVVRFIYWMALQGYSRGFIRNALEANRLLSPGGSGIWEAKTVEYIIQNEKYKGDALLQKTYTVDFLLGIRKKNEGEVAQYYIEDGHPAIIDRAVWDAVQEAWKHPARRLSYHPLAGMIHCADCGGIYGRKVWHSNTTRDIVWKCNNSVAGKTNCRCPHIYDYELETALTATLHRFLRRYQAVLGYCADFCRTSLLNIYEDHRGAALPGGLVFDDASIRLLIREVKITRDGYAVFRFINGSNYRYRLTMATPKGKPGTAAKRTNHQLILEMHEAGMNSGQIARKLGISSSTVRAYLRRIK